VRLTFDFKPFKNISGVITVANLSRRRLSLLFLAPFFFAVPASATEIGVKVRFRVSEKTPGKDGTFETRTYENAVLMSFGEKFTGDFQKEFRVSLLAFEMDNSAKVEIAVHDLRHLGVAVGQGSAVVPFVGETLLDLSKVGERSYSVFLRAEKHALPKPV